MKLPRVRFTVGRLMVVVAVSATLLAGWLEFLELRRLSVAYGLKAAWHVSQERRERRWFQERSRMRRPGQPGGPDLNSIVLSEAVMEHHRDWAARYLRASRRPWESVPTEPPPPSWETHRRALTPEIVARASDPGVLYLNLEDAGVTDDMLQQIGRCHQLRSLSLSRNPITDAGLAHLARLVRLERLSLAETRITDAGLAHLPGLTGLKSIDLYQTRVTRKGLDVMATSAPEADMYHDPGFDQDLGMAGSEELASSYKPERPVDFPTTRILKPGEKFVPREIRVRAR